MVFFLCIVLSTPKQQRIFSQRELNKCFLVFTLEYIYYGIAFDGPLKIPMTPGFWQTKGGPFFLLIEFMSSLLKS
jgi:hypothetical protein